MTNRKNAIKKPNFMIIYSISVLIVFILLLGVGALVYDSEQTKYYERVNAHSNELYKDITNSIFAFLDKNKEEIRSTDIALLKKKLVTYYSSTGEYIEVYKDNELVADAKKSMFLVYSNTTDGLANNTDYILEIADKKYLEYFNNPETYENSIEHPAGYGDFHEGLRTQPCVEFNCTEFYADIENGKFIPVVATVMHYNNDYMTESAIEIRITPDIKDIEGYTLVKIHTDTRGSAVGCMAGLEDRIDGQLHEGGRLDNNSYFDQTYLSIKTFREVYGNEIKIGVVFLVLAALFISLFPASIRYIINKRNYDIYEYRLQISNAMAHDLKTPLAAIAGYTESLLYHIGSDKQDYYAAKIGDKVAQMTGMINNILELSKSETLSGEINKENVDIGLIISEILADNEHTISNRSLKINYDQKNISVDTDRELFKQALANLIGNAVLHSKEGTEIDIRCDMESVVIVNTVAEKINDIKSIREPFVKGNESRYSNGSGLGLAIADNNLAMLRYKLDLKLEDDRFYAIVRIVSG